MEIAYSKEDYNPFLGVYQSWIHGDPTQQVPFLYCMSAFQLYGKFDGYVHQSPYHKYAEYLELSVDSILAQQGSAQKWMIRLYIDESILTAQNPDAPLWAEKLKKLMQEPRVQIICIKMPRYFNETTRSHEGLLSVMFRYLAMFDPNTSVMLFRDIDNIWTEQHQYFVDFWLSRGDDVCLFLNQNYKRQEIADLTPDGVILSDTYYNTVLSGLWNVKKPLGTPFPTTMWQKIFGYIESFTGFVFKPDYKNYVFYGNRFAYGFDELALSRVVMPIFIQRGMTFYAIPIKIYDETYYRNMFQSPALKKFLYDLSDSDTISTVENIMVNNYWHMNVENSGLSQYIVCILTNIYFRIITQKTRYNNAWFLNAVKTQVYPTVLLMSIGLFTFQNFNRYNWYPNGTNSGGTGLVNAFIQDKRPISLLEWTASSDLSNNGNGPDVPIPQPPPYYYGI